MIYRLLFFIFIVASYAQAEGEDIGFRLEVKPDPQVLVFFDGELFDDFILEYRPGNPELFIDGRPMLRLKIGPSEEECLEKYGDLIFFEDKIKSGFSCREAYFSFDMAVNKCLGMIRERVNVLKNQMDDRRVVDAILLELDMYEGGDLVENLKMEYGVPKVKIIGLPKEISVYLSDIPGEMPRNAYGPSRENLYSLATYLKGKIEMDFKGETLIAIKGSGATVKKSGPDMHSRVLRQIDSVSKQGSYVDGPVPESFWDFGF